MEELKTKQNYFSVDNNYKVKLMMYNIMPKNILSTSNYLKRTRLSGGGSGGSGKRCATMTTTSISSSIAAIKTIWITSLAPVNLFRIMLLVIIGCPGLNNGK